MKKHFYVYVLQSEKDSNFYVGVSTDLLQRLQQHQNGEVVSTKNRLPLTLVYWEGCLNQADATRREKYLKSSWGEALHKKSIKELSHGVKGMAAK